MCLGEGFEKGPQIAKLVVLGLFQVSHLGF